MRDMTDDARMFEGGEEVRLALEPRRVAASAPSQDLDGDGLPRELVGGFVDVAHASAVGEPFDRETLCEKIANTHSTVPLDLSPGFGR